LQNNKNTLRTRKGVSMIENNNEVNYDEPSIEDIAKMQWQRKAFVCSQTGLKHSWMAVAWIKTEKSSHVTALMCTQCFHEINLSEARENSSVT